MNDPISIEYRGFTIRFHEYLDEWHVEAEGRDHSLKHASLKKLKAKIDSEFTSSRRATGMVDFFTVEWREPKRATFLSLDEDGKSAWVRPLSNDGAKRKKVSIKELVRVTPKTLSIVDKMTLIAGRIRELTDERDMLGKALAAEAISLEGLCELTGARLK